MRWWAVLLVLLAACAPVRQRPKGFGASGTTAVELERALAPRRFALVVGVDEYEDPAFSTLKHAASDAIAMGDVLALPDTGGFDEVIRLIGPEAASRTRILEVLRELRGQVREQDSVLVYFSGHGTRQLDGGVWHRYLLPPDARVADLSRTALDLADLQGFLRGLSAKRVVLMVDACFHGGGKSVGDRPRPVDAPPLPPLSPSAGGLQVGEAYLFATTSGRPAREDDRLGHGIYTYYLLEAMQWGFSDADVDGDGVLTPWEAHDHARSRTLARTESVQVPEAAIRTVGEGDLVLAGSPQRRRDVERSLVYLYDGAAGLDGARVFVDGRERGTLPGTVVVSPEPHHVTVRAEDGRVVVDGDVSFRQGVAYRIDDLVRATSGPARSVGLRSGLWTAPALAEIGRTVWGIEAYGQRRAQRAPFRGVYVEGALGIGGSPARQVVDQRVANGRFAAWGTVAAGVQRDLGRLRLRGNLALTGRVFPPDALPAGGATLSQVGFWHLALGPGGGVGLVEGRTAVALEGRVLASWLDLTGAGRHLVVPVAWLGVSFETSPR